jgi:diaminopimelate decarboxylase
MFARDLHLPALAEGDLVALWPAGAYGAAMASNHCMRGLPTEVLI